ncbi:helix-turn-helix domain-containing protein [Actinomadura sp. ATCC 39365]
MREKVSIREIAREPGRAPSTLSREIRHNRHPTTGQYRPQRLRPELTRAGPAPIPARSGRTQSSDLRPGPPAPAPLQHPDGHDQ